MVKVECIIRPEKIADVKDSLANVGVHGMTVTEVIGCGFQKGHTASLNWNTELNINLLPKIKVEMIVTDDEVEDVIAAIVKVAKTGEIGDGKIFTSPITDAVRIRTEERGDKAI
ncbi:MAG: P-II family nitrogen regulator [Clostridia bacterium]|nr:P-II family nitrogen regulator [Clostridia bacterium]MDR3645715.1 P-II family nitrogen regulator [Clostridia bacterium]